jgi:hypothetical protein
MTNVPAKPQRDNNTVRMNANQITATRAQPNAIAVTKNASRQSRRIATAPRQSTNQTLNWKEFSAVSFFQSVSRIGRQRSLEYSAFQKFRNGTTIAASW